MSNKFKTAARLPCVVPFCRRTRPHEPNVAQWICGKHYALVDRDLRDKRRRYRRLLKRATAAGLDRAIEGLYSWLSASFDRAKSQAIERAMGAG
jgi:hypothetical protein